MFSAEVINMSVAKPLVCLHIGFYNIGWTDFQPGRDCAGAFEFNDISMLCLGEVGSNKLDENLHAHLGNSAGCQDKCWGQDVNIWLDQVIHECCNTSIDLQAYGPIIEVLVHHATSCTDHGILLRQRVWQRHRGRRIELSLAIQVQRTQPWAHPIWRRTKKHALAACRGRPWVYTADDASCACPCSFVGSRWS